jgi:hypothetical protein
MKTALDDFIDDAIQAFTESSPELMFYARMDYPTPPYVAIKNRNSVLFLNADTEELFAKRPLHERCKTCGQEIHASR